MISETFFYKLEYDYILVVLLWFVFFILLLLIIFYSQYKNETPFQVVLVDIKKAAQLNEIHCVEKPLTADNGLNFVALSYRWGELAETTIDTKLGYLASVTSFDLNDFYSLCKRMTQEKDLRNVNYVWVDALCIDQANYERRKATIYRMTDIYEHAKYIVAVPDLYLTYMKDTHTNNKEIIERTMDHHQYIYHLIHENMDQLVDMDEQWLDTIGVPKNQALRKMLANYSHSFGDSLLKYNVYDTDYDKKNALNHLRSSSTMLHTAHTSHDNMDFVCIDNSTKFSPTKGYRTSPYRSPTTKENVSPIVPFQTLPDTDDESMHDHDWPYHLMKEIKHDEWKQLILQRSKCIQHAMNFLTDLIKDWSSRVWVINEYSIAKKKQKMKYWFIQLEGPLVDDGLLRFFEFNFGDLSLSSRRHYDHQNCIFKPSATSHALTTRSNFIYQKFWQTMLHQLNQQSFLEMILKSKASRNEDRFYSILPMSEYKHKLGSKDVVDSWNINSMVSVKLKLYELMNTRDKLNLLFLSGKSSSQTIMVLPTFATTRIEWPMSDDKHYFTSLEGGGHHYHPCNFDLTEASTIMLIPTISTAATTLFFRKRHANTTNYKLNVKPCSYYTCDQSVFAETLLEKNKPLCHHPLFQQLDDDDRLDVVCIPSYNDAEAHHRHKDFNMKQLFLVGSFVENKWMILASFDFASVVDVIPQWTLHYANHHRTGFDIY